MGHDRWWLPLLFSVLREASVAVVLIAAVGSGTLLDPMGEPQPITKVQSVRCFDEQVNKMDDRNYEIEQRTQNEDVRHSVTQTRVRRNPNCVVKTEVIEDEGDKRRQPGIDFSSFNNDRDDTNSFNNQEDIFNIPNVNVARNQSGEDAYDYKKPEIVHPTFNNNFDVSNNQGGDYVSILQFPPHSSSGDEQEGYETVKKSGYSTDVQRQESYRHQGYSEEKTRRRPDQYRRPRLGQDGYEASANDIDMDWRFNGQVNLAGKAGPSWRGLAVMCVGFLTAAF